METTADYQLMLNRIDNLITKLGSDFGEGLDNDAKQAKNLITELSKDKIILPDDPSDFCIVDKKIYFEENETPSWLKEGIQEGYKFYFMRFPLQIDSMLPFNTVKFAMEFEKNNEEEKRPKFYKFFPNDEVKQVIEGSFSGNVTIDAGFNFKPIPENKIVDGKAEGKAALNLKFNFPFSFGKTEITASPEGLNHAEWTFTSKDMKHKLENFAALLKVPENTESIQIKINISGKRNTRKSSWLPDFLMKWIEIIHAKGDEEVKTFIKQGLPYTAPDTAWKLATINANK